MKAKCPVYGLPLPKVNGKVKGGVLGKEAKQSTQKPPLCRETYTPPTSVKMEPGPYFIIKNAFNGLPYSLVPQGH